MSNPILEMQNISKTFPGPVVANDDVSLSLYRGEVHALVGENGTGKSTLMNILYGLISSDSGRILLEGKPVKFKNPRDAIAHGIGMVHQHFMLIPSFTVAENLVFSFEPKKNGVFIDKAKAVEITRKLSERYGLFVEPEKKISECPLSMQQRVEILKILFHQAEILIFDEPTAVLTPKESEDLFHAFEELKKDGKSIVFITHKLREVIRVADRVTVMRKGKVIAESLIENTSIENMAEQMVGRKVCIANRKEIPARTDAETILNIENLTTKRSRSGMWLEHVSLNVKAGEIVGIAGVGGNGQDLLVSIINGLYGCADEGHIFYRGSEITNLESNVVRRKGIAHITGERYIRGVSSVSSIHDNLIMGAHRRKLWAGKVFLHTKRLRALSKELIQRLQIKACTPDVPIMTLSGGNIQKCVIARELNLAKDLIIAEEPTRGVDIGSVQYIHQTLVDRAKEGFGVLLISTDLDEILALSSRVLVMYEGSIIGEVDPNSPDSFNRIGLMMAGIREHGGVK